jgi:hypothetical protein
VDRNSRTAIRDNLIANALWAPIGWLVVSLGVLGWPIFRHGATLPIWAWILLGVVPAIFGLAQWYLRRHEFASANQELESLHSQIDSTQVELTTARAELDAVRAELETARLASYRANHVYQMLTALCKSMSHDIRGVTKGDFIERGVLEPARENLTDAKKQDVRLSLLKPDDTGTEWRMIHAAGHGFETRQNFNLKINQSFCRYAFEQGQAIWSNDLEADERFQRLDAEPPTYNSMISVPVRTDGLTTAVLNVTGADTGTFDEDDITHAKTLAAVVEIVQAVPQIPSASS